MSKMNKNTIPDNFTVGLAIFDFMPVLFFIISAVVLSLYLPGPCFIIGTLICFISGLLKVIWKIIVAVKKKNVWPLFLQMRILMPVGFLVMIIGVIVNYKAISLQNILHNISTMPSLVFFILWILGMIAMTICAFVLDSSNVKHNLIEQGINTVAQFCLLLGLIFIYLNNGSYEPNETARSAMESVPYLYTVETKKDQNIYFIPSKELNTDETETAFIFYPGGKVSYESYAPLMSMLASNNILCIIVKMPYDLAVFSPNKANSIMEQYPAIKHWYIGGHSLGGAMAANYAAGHANQLEGLILLAAYSQKDLNDSSLKVLSMYGSKDEVLNKESYEKYRPNLPGQTKEVIIEGGCHAYFGSYGYQKGDGTPDITELDQITFSALQISDFIHTAK